MEVTQKVHSKNRDDFHPAKDNNVPTTSPRCTRIPDLNSTVFSRDTGSRWHWAELARNCCPRREGRPVFLASPTQSPLQHKALTTRSDGLCQLLTVNCHLPLVLSGPLVVPPTPCASKLGGRARWVCSYLLWLEPCKELTTEGKTLRAKELGIYTYIYTSHGEAVMYISKAYIQTDWRKQPQDNKSTAPAEEGAGGTRANGLSTRRAWFSWVPLSHAGVDIQNKIRK